MNSFANRVEEIFGSLGADASDPFPWRIREQQQQERSVVRAPTHEEEEEENYNDEEEVELEAAEDDDDQERPSSPPCLRHFRLLRGPDGMDTEEDLEEEGLQMRSIIGLDTTLDFEEEEDEFDKTAVGREADKERLFMREINETDVKWGYSESLPRSLYDLKHVTRDPRANHLAAKARLEEDATKYAASLEESQGKNIADYTVVEELKTDLVSCLKRSIEPKNESIIDLQKSGSMENVKEEKDKSLKRVRFASDVKEQESNKEIGYSRPEPSSQFASQVPDYVRNPSKYTRYTLDWSVEDNEQANIKAFHACFETIRANQSTESEEDTGGLHERIQYIPRRGAKIVEENNEKIESEDAKQNVLHISKRSTVCIDEFEKENDVMMEWSNIMETGKIVADCFGDASSEGKMKKAERRYRSKREAETAMELDSPK